MKHNFNFVRLGLLLAFALGVSSCTPAKPVAEAEYSAKIVGNWLGTVGNMKESITFSGGGSFIAQLRPKGSSATQLSQRRHRHDPRYWHQWQDDHVEDTSAEDERVNNSVTSSTILAFNQDELR